MPEFFRNRETGERFYRDESGNFVPVPSDAGGAARTALNTATFGFSDEARGLAQGAASLLRGQGFGQGYEAGLEAERAALDAFSEARPVASVASSIAGGLVPGFGTARLATRAASTLRGLVARAAGVSAAEGAVTGFGMGRGGAGNRAQSAAVGGGVSGVVGGAIPAVGAGLNALRPTVAQRAALVGQSVDDLDDVARNVQRMGPGATLADADQNLFAVADEAMQRVSGPASRQAADALEQRSRQSFGRITETLRRTTGGIDDAAESLDDMQRIRREVAAPLYQQAFADAPEPPERLNQLLSLRSVRRAWNEAREDGLTDIVAGSGPDLPVNMTAADLAEAEPSLLGWHFIQSRLGAQIRELERAAPGTAGRTSLRALKQQRRAILDELDELPGYREARQIYAGAEANREAVQLGERLLTADLSDVRQIVSSLDESQLPFARMGFGQAIENTIARTTETGQVSSRLRSQQFRELVEGLFPDNPEAARAMLDRVAAEETFQNTFRGLQNSATARRQNVGEQMRRANPVRAARSAVTGEPAAAMFDPSETVQDQLAAGLMSQDPQVQARLLQMMRRPVGRAAIPPRAAALGIGVAPGVAALPGTGRDRRLPR